MPTDRLARLRALIEQMPVVTGVCGAVSIDFVPKDWVDKLPAELEGVLADPPQGRAEHTDTQEGERFQIVPMLPYTEQQLAKYDIGDDARAAIVRRLIDDWQLDTELTIEKKRQLAMFAAASVRSLLCELGVLRDLAAPTPADGAPPLVDEA